MGVLGRKLLLFQSFRLKVLVSDHSKIRIEHWCLWAKNILTKTGNNEDWISKRNNLPRTLAFRSILCEQGV